MAKNSEDRSLFLRALNKYPYIYYASKEAGISRATVHRWMKSNPDFADAVRKAKQEGLANQNEKIEMVLVNNAQKGMMAAVKFYLTHNSKKYRPVRPDFPAPPISAELREQFRKVYEWAVRNKPLPPEMSKQIWDTWKRFKLVDENNEFTGEMKEKMAYLTKDWEEFRRRKKYGH